ncbi:polysaccharide deacetylase family protein [Rarobacter incanus]|uniref:Secreted protein n=1 Tax=Rarobacter incanus TaxID=153494 RepID=A0A542SNI1_9MICO|nr:polysaccharide deacetylase family protein [Rarobacter incanus]TQK76173.1 secreted protein [Rarobacter incanus]
MVRRIDRRGFLKLSGAAAVGTAIGAGGLAATEKVAARGHLDFYHSYAASIHAGRVTPPKHRDVSVVWAGPAVNEVALTFDDGPAPDWTPRVLRALADAQAPATFFVQGNRLLENGHILAGAITDHEIGIHTWDHSDMGRMSLEEVTNQLVRMRDLIVDRLAVTPTLMRPPYGHIAGSTLLACNELGLTPVLWNLQMLDANFRSDPAGLTRYIGSAVSAGSIVLAHDVGNSQYLVTIDELPAIIAAIRARGFKLVTVSQLLRAHSPVG